MKVKDLIKFLEQFPKDTVVLAEGFAMDGVGPHCGELNVAENKNGKPYLCHYQIGISFDGGKTWKT